MAFSPPPAGSRGYDEDEVDAYLARVEAQPAPGGPGRKTHYVLYALRGAAGLQPTVVAEVDGGALRVMDSASNELLGTAMLAEVDLVDEFTPQTFVDHALAFFEESGDGGHWTWRTFLVFGVLALALTFFVGEHAWMFAAGGAGLLLVSAAFWRFNWRF
ncbi:MAG: DivIVA domain-containing protein [Mycolicibacterium cosmeticum]|nr:DivIVA domain-containing protein [Mycolicibacterium cosmeticum]